MLVLLFLFLPSDDIGYGARGGERRGGYRGRGRGYGQGRGRGRGPPPEGPIDEVLVTMGKRTQRMQN